MIPIYLLSYYLKALITLGISEKIDINMSADRSGGVVVDCKTCAHEESAVVKHHLEFRSDRRTVLPVGAVG